MQGTREFIERYLELNDAQRALVREAMALQSEEYGSQLGEQRATRGPRRGRLGEARGIGFVVRTLERHSSSRGEESVPPWKAEARELMAGLRQQIGESRSRWAEENAARKEEVREFMAQLRADLGKGDPADLPEMVELDCGYCGGNGTLRGANCPVCWGKGQVRVRAPYEKCDRCGGSGGVPGTALTCIKCKGTGYLTVGRKRNACPRCGGSGLEPEEELSLKNLRERRKKGLPAPRRGRARPLCALCQGTGVADWLDRAPEATSRASKGMVENPGTEAPWTPAMREPLSLEERVLGYIVGWPGVKCADIEILFGLSKVQAQETLQGLVKRGKLHLNGELYYPVSTPTDYEEFLARGALTDQGDDSLEFQSVPKASR